MAYFAPEESAFGVGFFERLEANTQQISRIEGPVATDVLNSIKNNIASILNTRVGGSQSAPELGLVDFNDASLSTMELSLKIKLAIQYCIRCYEPRLKEVTVRFLTNPHDPLTLKFHLTAVINSEAIHDQVEINLLLDQNRKYRVL